VVSHSVPRLLTLRIHQSHLLCAVVVASVDFYYRRTAAEQPSDKERLTQACLEGALTATCSVLRQLKQQSFNIA
jgi:hypothetical protein